MYRGIEFITEPEFRKLDDRVWLKLKKEYFVLESDLFIGIWYIPPTESSKLQQTMEMWSVLEHEISFLNLKEKYW